MLAQYQTQTQQLLQNPPSAASSLYALSDLTDYINTARGQIAGEGECIRVYGTLAAVAGTRAYPFSGITLSGVSGVEGVFNVRGATIGVASGQSWLHPRPFPYFQLYYLNNPVPEEDTPVDYSVYGQGSAGSIYLNPVPDQSYTLSLDCVCYPVPLVDDITAEALPYPWTDCVAYFAAYLALLSAQRTSDADHMFQLYQTFMSRARQFVNGAVNPGQYSQQGNPTRSGQLGVTPKGQ